MTVREMMEKALATAAAQKRVVEGVNDPSVPFEGAHGIDLAINFDSYEGAQRTFDAELWCLYNTQGRWFRRIFAAKGVARFEFEHLREATLFWLDN